MDKQNQKEIVKLDICECAGFYSAFINDWRISKRKPLSSSKTVLSIDCPKQYILDAIGIPKDAVVLTREQYDNMFEYKTTRGGFLNILDTVRKVEREETVEKITKNIGELMATPFEGKTDKQMLQRKGMEEGLKMALDICEEIMEGVDNEK